MKQKLKIGLLGAGSIGTRHAANLETLGVSGIAFWEPEEKSRHRAREKSHALFPESREAFWEWNPDAVFVCTPSAVHYRDTAEAVQLGKDIFVEKPFATSMHGCRDLAAEAEKRNLVTMVACNMRFHPGPVAIKKILENGTIGKIFGARLHVGSHLPGWRPWQDYKTSYSADPEHGGALLDCIHEIDLALWIFGPAELAGAATTKADLLELSTDGAAELLLRHETGLVSSLHLNYMQRDYRRFCQVFGSEGSVYWDFSEAKVHLMGTEKRPLETMPLPPPEEINEMYLQETAHFLACVESRQATCNPLTGGIDALEIALQARNWKK